MQKRISFDQFNESLSSAEPPSDLSNALKALWWDAKGAWQTGHDFLRDAGPKSECHVHAYLHRKEGVDWNARYWYDRADEPFFEGSLEEEWTALVRRYLK